MVLSDVVLAIYKLCATWVICPIGKHLLLRPQGALRVTYYITVLRFL